MFANWYEFSNQIALALQGLGDWFIYPMKFFTFLGTENFYLLIMPIVVWVADYNLGIRMGIILLTSGWLNNAVKMSFKEPRPFWYTTEVKRLGNVETGFGIPSGHSQNPLAILGYVIVKLKKRWATILFSLVIFLIGFSRLVLGMHFIQDILLGWTLGLILLWVFIKLEDKVIAWFNKFKIGQKILIVFVISLTMIGISFLVISLGGDYQVPEGWMENAILAQPEEPINPLTLESAITNAAALFGLACGIFWISNRGGFEASKGSGGKLLLRFIVGLIGVVVLWKGLDMVFPGEENLIGYIFRYIRYGLVGFWITGLSIVLFEKMGLVGEKE